MNLRIKSKIILVDFYRSIVFLSTSTNRDVALMFTGDSSSSDSNIEFILFEIKIDVDKCRRSFANIKCLSFMEEDDEILFTIATVFRIESVERLDLEGIWLIYLIVNDEELNLLAKNIKDEIAQTDGLYTVSGLLMKMGDLEAGFRHSEIATNIAHKTFPLNHHYIQVAENLKSKLSIFYNEMIEKRSKQ
ncbi:hypothetical protein I4U23_028183 [Adineta vaga]|nr:hypothetical protein I4U23_028183 [Adineta vaga]